MYLSVSCYPIFKSSLAGKIDTKYGMESVGTFLGGWRPGRAQRVQASIFCGGVLMDSVLLSGRPTFVAMRMRS